MKLQIFEYKTISSIIMILTTLYFLPCDCISSKISNWTPCEISKEYHRQGMSYIFDPNRYLNREHLESIKKIINKTKTEKNYEIFVILINNMDGYLKYRIEEFLEETAFLILNRNIERDNNSLFILCSFQDRQS